MKSYSRAFVISMVVALLIVFCFSNLSGEISLLGLFPGYMLRWIMEQTLIEILKEPYFMLDKYWILILNFVFYFSLLFLGSGIWLSISRNLRKISEY